LFMVLLSEKRKSKS